MTKTSLNDGKQGDFTCSGLDGWTIRTFMKSSVGEKEKEKMYTENKEKKNFFFFQVEITEGSDKGVSSSSTPDQQSFLKMK